MADPDNHDTHVRGRTIASRVLLVCFCAGLLLSVVTVWARIEMLNTDAFVTTVSPLASDPEIQEAIADRVTELIATGIRGDDATIAALGSGSLVRGVGMSLLVGEVHRTVLAIVQSSAFQDQWDSAVAFAHRNLVTSLTGGQVGSMTIENGQLVLDLMPIVTAVGERLRATGLDFLDRIQIAPDQARIVLFESASLAKAQRLIEQVKLLSVILPVVTVVALAGGIALASNRWLAVMWTGIGATVAMVVLVILIAIGRRLAIDALGTGVNVPAATSLINIVLRGLRQAARIVALAGMVVAAIGWVRTASFARRPAVIETVRKYQGAICAAIVAVVSMVILMTDDLDPVRTTGYLVLAAAGAAIVLWIPRMSATVST